MPSSLATKTFHFTSTASAASSFFFFLMIHNLIFSSARCGAAFVRSSSSAAWSFSTALHDAGRPSRMSARQRQQAREKHSSSSAPGTLEWETFDYDDSPKWDARFGADQEIHLASNKDNWEDIVNDEESEDAKLREKFERIHSVWDNLDLDLIERATNVLVPFLKPERWDRIQNVLSQRTQNVRFMFENPANPSNVWACLRTLDSFGIQHVDVVMQSAKYKGKAALSQKRGMRTAMGSAKWLTLKNHVTTKAAMDQLKENGYHIVCTDVNPESKDIRDVDWSASGKKICIVMGNEQEGISDDVKTMADESFYLPMTGMAESFNLSVATAITCAHLSATSQEVGQGAIRNGDLDEKEYKTLLLKGALNSMDRRTVKALFKREGIEFPKDIHIA